jgi:hypothetical protein
MLMPVFFRSLQAKLLVEAPESSTARDFQDSKIATSHAKHGVHMPGCSENPFLRCVQRGQSLKPEVRPRFVCGLFDPCSWLLIG